MLIFYRFIIQKNFEISQTQKEHPQLYFRFVFKHTSFVKISEFINYVITHNFEPVVFFKCLKIVKFLKTFLSVSTSEHESTFFMHKLLKKKTTYNFF